MSLHSQFSQTQSDKKSDMDIQDYIQTVVWLRLAFEVVKDRFGYHEVHKTDVFDYLETNCTVILNVQEGDIEYSYAQGDAEFLPTKGHFEDTKKLHYHITLECPSENTLRKYLGNKFVKNGQKEGNLRWSLSKVKSLSAVLRYSCKGASVDNAPTIVFIAGHLDGVQLHTEYWETNKLIFSGKKKDKRQLSKNILEECYEKCTDTLNAGVLAQDIYRFYVNKRMRLPVQSQFSQLVNTFVAWNNERSDNPLPDSDMVRRLYPRLEF